MSAAALVVIEHKRRQEEEEQEMTNYHSRDLAEDWEFKILRSCTGAFSSPAMLQHACDEEAQSGWILVEKFDDSRLRFKRPATAKRNDSYDLYPYRTYYGISEGVYYTRVVLITLGLTVLGFLGFFAILAI